MRTLQPLNPSCEPTYSTYTYTSPRAATQTCSHTLRHTHTEIHTHTLKNSHTLGLGGEFRPTGVLVQRWVEAAGPGRSPGRFFNDFFAIFKQNWHTTRPTAPRWKAHIETCHKKLTKKRIRKGMRAAQAEGRGVAQVRACSCRAVVARVWCCWHIHRGTHGTAHATPIFIMNISYSHARHADAPSTHLRASDSKSSQRAITL